MLCAHTVRRLKPGAFDEFIETFVPTDENAPAGWVRFHALRSLDNENEVVTFGFFDGTLDELNASQSADGFNSLRAKIDPLVEAVVANGIYDVHTTLVPQGAAAS